MMKMANNIGNERLSKSRSSTLKRNGIAILALLLLQIGTTPVRAVVDELDDHDQPVNDFFSCFIDTATCFIHCIFKTIPNPDPTSYLKCAFDCGSKVKCECNCGKGPGPKPPGPSPKPPGPRPKPPAPKPKPPGPGPSPPEPPTPSPKPPTPSPRPPPPTPSPKPHPPYNPPSGGGGGDDDGDTGHAHRDNLGHCPS